MLLLRFLNNCDFDLEKAENLLHKNLKSRKKCPALFESRDVTNAAYKETRKVVQVFPMPKLTPEGYEIIIFRLIEKDPDKFDLKNALRSNLTMLDAKFLTDTELTNGSIGLIDLNGFGFKHFWKFMFCSPSLQSSYGKFVHQATPFKPIFVHAVHAPAIVKACMSIVGPLVRRNYNDLVKFKNDFAGIEDTIPKELIPNEFGGSAGFIDDIHDNWIKVLESKRLVD